MIVRPGHYYETPLFKDLGSSREKPVWILSEQPGAAVISGLWREAEQGAVDWAHLGDDIYEAVHGDAFMGDAEGHFLFRYKSPGDLIASSVIGIEKPPYGFAHQNGRLYLRLPGGADPNQVPVRLTDTFSQTIVTIENLALRHSRRFHHHRGRRGRGNRGRSRQSPCHPAQSHRDP